MTDFREEIIVIFMSKSKESSNLTNGLGKIPQVSEIVSKATSLIQTFIAFEAFTNWKYGSTNTAKDNQKEFCETYKDYLEEVYAGISQEINELYDELNKEPLPDMGNPRKQEIKIENKKDFSRIFEVMYRVRGNIIHGNKGMREPRNVLLIKNSSDLLYKIFSQVLNNKEEIIF